MLGFITVFHTFLLFLFFKDGSTLNVSVALIPPSNTPILSPSFLSFSIEQDRWTDWVGAPSRNDFFFNTLENLRRLSGKSPRLRIGANSEDNTIYDSSVRFSEAIFPAPSAKIPYPEATNVSVGDTFFTTAQFLPSDTRVIWGLNLGQRNLTATFLEARALLKAFSLPSITDAGIVLEAIEIGNEADLYGNNGMRAQGYDEVAYVKEWVSFATNISIAFNLSSKSLPRFWGASFAGSSGSTTGFSPQAIIDQGILNTYPGELMTTISQHRYSGSFCYGSSGLLQDLMSKDSIRGNLTVFSGDIKAVLNKGLEYVLGETNSYACHGAPGVSNTAGAALWMLDYLFFASQIGISRVHLHQGIGFKYNLMQPTVLLRSPIDGTAFATPMAPHIQPPYYAAIIAAEVLGQVKPNGAAGAVAVRALELAIDHPRVAAYAFYSATEGSSSRLSKLLLINSQAYLKNVTRDMSRGRVHIDLWFPVNTNVNSTTVLAPPQLMTIKRLAIPHADDTAGITWAGQTYETSNGQISGELKVEKSAVEGGLDLWDTEAVLVYFD